MRLFAASRSALAVLAAVAATPALAHIGPGHSHGMADGFIHPFTGLDHLLVIIGVGLMATLGGGKARWHIPLSFLVFFVVGGMLGIGHPLASIETGVVLSVMGIGLWIVGQRHGAPLVAAPLVGVVGFLHGWAHGGEQVVGNSSLLFIAGALVASLFLSLASAVVGRYIASLPAGQKLIQRLTGSAILLAGIGIAAS